MTRIVFACQDCGEEVAALVEACPQCGGPAEQVDPHLVATMDAIEAVLSSREDR